MKKEQKIEENVLILGDPNIILEYSTLEEGVIELCRSGYRKFYTPLFCDFDYSTVEILLDLKSGGKNREEYPDIEVVVVIEKFYDSLKDAENEQIKRFAKILDSATQIVLTTHIESNTVDAVEYCNQRTSMLFTITEEPPLVN